jgi:hypothetical protein
MLGSHFYHSCIKKTVVAFGTLFNNIQVIKKDPETNVEIERQKVAVAYGPKNKFLARLEQNPEVGRKVAITLPRISFEMTTMNYDPSRKTSPIQYYLKEDGSSTSAKKQYMPVPYNIGFELGIIAKSQDDALQIIEQILPFFQPAFTITVNMIPDMEEKRDIAYVLNSIDYEDDYEDDFMTRRSIIYTLGFTAKTYLYGPLVNADLIRKSVVEANVGDLNQHKRTMRYTTQPEAKTDLNADSVIDAADTLLLNPDDDFGFNEGIEIL